MDAERKGWKGSEKARSAASHRTGGAALVRELLSREILAQQPKAAIGRGDEPMGVNVGEGIRNALAFLVEARMREMVRDAREYELKGLLTDLFGERAAAATVKRLLVRMDTGGLDSP